MTAQNEKDLTSQYYHLQIGDGENLLLFCVCRYVSAQTERLIQSTD